MWNILYSKFHDYLITNGHNVKHHTSVERRQKGLDSNIFWLCGPDSLSQITTQLCHSSKAAATATWDSVPNCHLAWDTFKELLLESREISMWLNKNDFYHQTCNFSNSRITDNAYSGATKRQKHYLSGNKK